MYPTTVNNHLHKNNLFNILFRHQLNYGLYIYIYASILKIYIDFYTASHSNFVKYMQCFILADCDMQHEATHKQNMYRLPVNAYH